MIIIDLALHFLWKAAQLYDEESLFLIYVLIDYVHIVLGADRRQITCFLD